jgi:hypothetical protein
MTSRKLVRSNGYQPRRALVEYKSETIKGIVYVMLPVYAGGYSITYGQRPIFGAMTFGGLESAERGKDNVAVTFNAQANFVQHHLNKLHGFCSREPSFSEHSLCQVRPS